ncbi:HD-GYP domain-containing protein, partial [Candidatus Venteria ishoeyi]
APMHDIGKIGIPDAILRKPGKLDDTEWTIMKQHPEIGANILKGDTPLQHMARDIALYHHEKWDGSGYPQGLAGTQITLAARIVAVADVFDALTTVRPYKAAWPVEKAVEFMQKQAGQHFDPDLVRLFLNALPAILEIKEKWKEALLAQ